MSKHKNKKSLLIIAIIVVVLVIVAVVSIFIHNNNVYRLITVDSMEGTVELKREGKLVEIFTGLHLKSGDTINTGEQAYVLLLADEDKHILAEENTGFSVTATGNEEKGGITINLEYGSTLITIDNKLEEESSFELQTPNAALSVRGTVFRTTYDREAMCTIVEILEGTVEIASETNTILGNAGEEYYVDAQGLILSEMPDQETEENQENESNQGAEGNQETEGNQGTEGNQEIGTDIEPLPNEGLVSPLTITQGEFESQYMEERIELTSENSREYFEVIQKDGTYYFVLKPGYTAYGDGYTVELDNGDSTRVSTGASRYLFYMEGSGNAEGWIESWVASGTIVKYNIPDDMWCKAGDVYIILITMDNGNVYSIQR